MDRKTTPAETPGRALRPYRLAALLLILLAAPAGAAEPGALPLKPGEVFPAPPQRGLDEIAEVPTRKAACPVCGYVVAVPEVDTLMRRGAPPRPAKAQPWSMDAASRDDDLCPYPGPGKLAYQADVVICPSCGYAAGAKSFSAAVEPETAKWVRENLTSNLRQAEKTLLGKRALVMDENAIVEFFNRQEEIPDTVRLEHARVLAEAARLPALARAEATWLAAWALRREVAGPPKGAFFAKLAKSVQQTLNRQERKGAGVTDGIAALAALTSRPRGPKDHLDDGERMAARFLMAGLLLRKGYGVEADRELSRLYLEARERFLRPDQDPFWPHTSTRAAAAARVAELDAARAEVEAEISVRLELLAQERELVLGAATLIRAAMLAGEFKGKPDEALFHAYLTGEFLRRHDDLALAAEWFKNTLPLTAAGSPLRTAVEDRIAAVRDQAGDRINLLSALGQDAEYFDKLREICGGK